MIYFIIFLAVIVLIILFFVSIYNALIRLRNQVKNAWAQIDVQLKRRHDLIPNLIETVKGYMTHERQIMENITKYRSQAMNAQTVGEKAQAESLLSGALGQLRVQVENYPDLKANQNFLALQEELTATENKISFARQNYNDQVLMYNNKIQMFPSNIVAGMFNFKEEEFFEIKDVAEKEVPKVSFN
ncbi:MULTISPECIES: LemA family protein [Ignavibacterium]|jgi:LemA protein|uniref:LemA family protein n=1 Tax=Ignavibacterium TaxID=795750 RepID=UPI0025BBA5E1|nr:MULTISPECIES: LemA family protein [Ignavibacterium]MBI5661169.1 LemA family protein [Ignavibacterium album]